MPETLHYLFVCYANMDRSPTAEAVCSLMAHDNNLDIEASSAGVSEDADRPVTKQMADLADKIFVMEPAMVTEMVEKYGQNPAKVVCLDIPDAYFQNAPDLVQILEAKMYEHFDREELI
jgi:predicted protein tyrosine phosphatase